MKTANSIEELKAAAGQSSVGSDQPKRKQRGDATRIAPWKWQKGQSGNPGGRPKDDVAKQIAQAVFEQNPEAIYAAMSKALTKGNAYVFKELAERAFGKLKETHEVQGLDGMAEALAKARNRVK